MYKIKKRVPAEPDFDDPFRPDLDATNNLRCLHCGETYPEKLVVWDADIALWVCKNFKECGGAGVGVDLWRLDAEGKVIQDDLGD